MSFVFDAEAEAQKLSGTPANPAKAANPEPKPATISNVSNFSSGSPSDPHGWGYTLDDLREIDKLIRDLGTLEEWTDAEIQAKLDERLRMRAIQSSSSRVV